jgi:hypothetical protein
MALWNGPTISDTLTANDLITSALDQPMSKLSTFWETGTQAALDSPILGTAITEMRLPPRYVDPNSPVLADRIQALNNDGEPITEDEFKASENYRTAVPFDKGMTRERQAALAEMEDIRQARAFYASKRPVTALVGTLAGSALDPINYVPFLGPASRAASVARFGRVAGTALVSSADAAINTAVASAATASTRALYGQDTSFDTIVSDVAVAALIGGAFGAVAGSFGRRADLRQAAALEEAKQRLATLRRTQESRMVLNDAVQSLAIDGEVRLSPAAIDVVERTAADVQRTVSPTRAATLKGEDLPIAYGALPERGLAPAQVAEDGALYIGREGGSHIDISMAKSVEERGQWTATGFATPDGKFLTRAEALAWVKQNENPDFKPSENMAGELDALDYRERVKPADRKTPADLAAAAQAVRSAVRLPDGRVVIGEAGQTHADIMGALPEAVVEKIDEKDIAFADANTGAFLTEQDAMLRLKPTGSSRLSSVDLARAQTPQAAPTDRAAAEGSAAAATVNPVANDNAKAIADQFGVNAETGDFVEAAELDALRNSGRLTEDEIRMLDEADQAKEAGDAFAEALKAAVGCML